MLDGENMAFICRTLLGGVDIQADPFNFKGCLRIKICF